MKRILNALFLYVVINNFVYGQISLQSEPINSGYVFIDGKYIEAPYIVELSNNTLFINGVKASRKFDVDQQEVQKDYVKPNVPSSLTASSKVADLYNINVENGVSLFPNTISYYHSLYNNDTAIDSIYNFIKGLPCIKSSNIENGHLLHIEDYHGNKGIYDLRYWAPEIKRDQSNIDAILERDFRITIKKLQHNLGYFLSSSDKTSYQITLPLKKLIKAIESSDKSINASQIDNSDLPSTVIKELRKHSSQSDQLMLRMDSYKKKSY